NHKEGDPPLNFRQADVYEVVLHELMHSIGQGQQSSSRLVQNRSAYQQKLTADIEEGMTEIGAAVHLADFVRALGAGDTPTYAGTLHNLATRMGLNSNLESGATWGHYHDKVTRQYRFLQMVASLPAYRSAEKSEGKRVKKLVQEISRVGVGDKLGVM